MITIKETAVQILSGTDIDGAIDETLLLVNKTNAPVKFNFNGINVVVGVHSTKAYIINKWYADKKVISDKWKLYKSLKQELGAE